jgi:hydrogenase/urease accessory protein HupE
MSKKVANDKIVELAALQLKIDRSASASDDDVHNFERGLEPLEGYDHALLMLAVKLMAGMPYRVIGDNQENISRCRSMAEHLGASVEQK